MEFFWRGRKIDKLKLVHRTTRTAGLAGDPAGGSRGECVGKRSFDGMDWGRFWVEEGEGQG